jgi:hypothetical protein
LSSVKHRRHFSWFSGFFGGNKEKTAAATAAAAAAEAEARQRRYRPSDGPFAVPFSLTSTAAAAAYKSWASISNQVSSVTLSWFCQS